MVVCLRYMTDRDTAQEVLHQTQQLADEWIRPQAERWQRERVMGLEAVHEAARLNLLGVQVPVALGGLGLPFSVKSSMAAILAEADFGFALSLINTQGVASTLANWLPPEVSQRWLGDLLTGQRMGCTCLTEPGAGSDAASLKTKAVREGDELTEEVFNRLRRLKIDTIKVFASYATVDLRDELDIDSIDFKVRQDFGVGHIDPRGAYKASVA